MEKVDLPVKFNNFHKRIDFYVSSMAFSVLAMPTLGG
jgi:hypothetical protein